MGRVAKKKLIRGLGSRSTVGGYAIKKILRSRLPERFADKVPPLLVELGVGVFAAVASVLLRLALTPVAGDRAPYALVFLGIVMACVAAGWRSGVIALAIGQAVTWTLVVSSNEATDPGYFRLGGFVIATIAQLVLLITITLYQREVAKGVAAREQRLTLLDEALREIDHRTRNNYQTVLAMVELQSRRTTDDNVRAALRQVADRIQAVANATNRLATQSGELGSVKLDDHLCELVDQLARGLSRENVEVECDIEDVTASPDAATSVSIIVNELVTNALKHAFNGEQRGRILVTGRSGRGFELVVADDGRGMKSPRRKDDPGLGTKLVESFARQLGAEHRVTSSSAGTTHRLLIPSLDG